MLRAALSIYKPPFAKTVIYMLQASEYNLHAYLAWFWRTNDFSRVMNRKKIVLTRPAKLLLAALWAGVVLQILAALFVLLLGIQRREWAFIFAAAAIFLPLPLVWAHLIAAPVLLGRWLINGPYTRLRVRAAAQIFAAHPANKIAVAGSYGKTTMKEILLTVLGEGKKVAATPANRNVAISHAQFAKSLKGDEEILIIEYGEGAPGDVKRFAANTNPNTGIITGLAPAHLDRYKTLQAAGRDIFTLARYLKDRQVYVNIESAALRPFTKKTHEFYSIKGVLGWQTSNIKTGLDGTSFNLKKAGKTLKLKSGLVGEQQVGPLALAVALGLKLGLSEDQVKAGVAKTKPFDHRLQPLSLAGGWLIDDTYNGNIDGMLAGLKLLTQLPARRKIYVTPGLVDQGEETQNVHHQLGEAIATSNPNIVVLMQNSVTDLIKAGLKAGKYKGEVRIEKDPLGFYTNIDQVMAAGDVVLMQNDWPDNYI